MAREGTRRHVRQGTRAVVALLIAALAAATFVPLVDTNVWWVRFLSYPRFQFLCALAVLLGISLALPDRFRPAGLLCSLVAAGALAYQCRVFIPYTPLEPVQALSASPCSDDRRLAVLAVNLQMTNEHDRRLFDEIQRTRPGIVLAQEVDQWWHDRLQQLHDAYPHQKHYVTRNYYGISLLSRHPLVDPEIRFLAEARDPAVFTGVRLPSGRVVRFYGVHPRPPTFGQSSAERDAQLMAAALAIAGDERPAIVAGDFNATPWSPIVRRTARIGRLLDPRIGRGWKPTWKANGIARRWPLDQVLFSNAFTVEEFRVLPPMGSDHQPTLTRLCLAPVRSAAQPAPRPDPGDLAAAQAAIRTGTGRAAPSPEPPPGAQSG